MTQHTTCANPNTNCINPNWVGPQDDLDNHSVQLDPEQDEYWHSRDDDCANQDEYEDKHGDEDDGDE